MDPNNFRRGRSPPFGYHQTRPPMEDFDNPNAYHPMEQYDGPAHTHQMGLPSMHQQPLPPHIQPQFIDGPSHHDYPPDYRDHPRLYTTNRMPFPHRDAYPSSPVNHQPRASSPPYKILCITNINHKISDGPVKDALTSDFSRFGDISVSICHDSGERLAYIYFRGYDEAREARNTMMRALIFDRPIEIEPIYEQNRAEPVGPPPPGVSPMMMPTQPVYPSRRRSISPPPPNYPQDINEPTSHRRALPTRPHLSYGLSSVHSGFSYQRGTPPPEYNTQANPPNHIYSVPPSNSMAMGPAMVYDRRINYDDGGYNQYPSPHVNPTSPYSTPPHEHYRPSYPNSSVSSAIHHPMSRSERDRIPSDPRSPRSETYHQIEPPVPLPNFSQHDHRSSRAPVSQHMSSRHRSRPYPSKSSMRNQAEPPMRFMSREYRREKFGGDHGPGEHEEGKPSRVLLVNNIDLSKNESDVRETFEPFGTIEDMEVKKVGSDISSAIIKFTSMDGAYKAKTAKNGRFIGNTRCRIVYGKVSASRKLWIGGLSPTTTVSSLENECGRYGDIVCMEYTPGRPYCYVEFESPNQAQFAAHHLKSTLTPAPERKIRVEFVDLERSERLGPRQDSNPQTYDTNTKLRLPNESTYELAYSPHSTNSTSGKKRAQSPVSDALKGVCQASDLPLGSNTFKQERLVAAAAAKARTSSTASSQLSDRFETNKTRDSADGTEMNNNGDMLRSNNGDLETSLTPTAFDHQTQEAPSLDKLSHCTTIREVLHCCSVSWSARLALKNTLFPAQMYLCSGSKELIDKYLSPLNDKGDLQCPLLSITQRWRLHPQPKLEVVKRRMQSGNLGILVITSRLENQKLSTAMRISCDQVALSVDQLKPATNESHTQNGILHKASVNESTDTPNSLNETNSTTTDLVDSRDGLTSMLENSDTRANDSTPNRQNSASGACPATQSKSIRNLISYLGQKDAAGVISLSSASELPQSADGPPKLLYTFPPGEFALNLLRRMAPNLAHDATKEEFLLGVISRGNLEGKI